MHHLGWEFTSKRFLPPKFYGLTRKAVKPKPLPQNADDVEEDEIRADSPEESEDHPGVELVE